MSGDRYWTIDTSNGAGTSSTSLTFYRAVPAHSMLPTILTSAARSAKDTVMQCPVEIPPLPTLHNIATIDSMSVSPLCSSRFDKKRRDTADGNANWIQEFYRPHLERHP